MVFKVAELDIVVRIDSFLSIDVFCVLSKANFALEIILEAIIYVVLVADIECLVNFRVGQAHHSACAVCNGKYGFNGLAQPEAIEVDLRNLFPCLQPELERDQRGNIAAEAVYNTSPHFERLYLVIPEIPIVVIKINYIKPFPHLVAETSVRLVIEPFWMILGQPGVGRRVVIYNVDDALHAARVNVGDKLLQVINRSILGIDLAVIRDSIRAA